MFLDSGNGIGEDRLKTRARRRSVGSRRRRMNAALEQIFVKLLAKGVFVSL